MKKKNKKLRSFFLNLIITSAAVFFFIIISTWIIFWAYALFWKLRYGDGEAFDWTKFPMHFNDYLFALISLATGLALQLFAKRHFFSPLMDLYRAIEKISEGDYSVKITPKGFVAIKKIARKINAMTFELKTVEDMRNDLVNNFSHEFKTPLHSINGFAKLLKDESLSEESRNEYIDIILRESERMSNLTKDVLLLSSLNNTSILTHIEKFNVSEQIRLVVLLLSVKWERKNIDIDFDCEEHFIEGNQDLIQQIWINLLDNAIKFSPEASIIKIKAERKGDMLFFTFTDNGKGMDEITAKHAFERFYQGDLSHKNSGNGIGLATAKKICELHKGDIIIKSTNETGSVFEVSLPIEYN